MQKKVMIISIGLLLVAAVFISGLGALPSVGANPSEEYGIISVYGEAVIIAAPDSAQVVLAIETTHDSANTAAEDNARLTDAVINALIKSGLDEKQIKTSGYSVTSYHQQIDSQNREKYTTTFMAYNELNVNLQDLDKVGNVIDTAIKAGVNRVLSVRFELKDVEALKLQALQNATTQAKAKASAIARSAGVSIKGIKAIKEEMSSYSPYRASMEDSMLSKDGAITTPILPGDVEVTARVIAEYRF